MGEERGLQQVKKQFEVQFELPPDVLGVAPGRVNLIGEHTDYNDGFVFPAAIDRQAWIAARITTHDTTLYSTELGQGASFDVVTVKPGDVKDWSAYGAGIAWALREETKRELPNLEIVIHSEVPIGSGISSSAALELAFAVVWNEAANLGIENKQLALIGQKCENKYVGVNSGIMDQMASAMGREDHAMFLDTRSLEITYARIPDELTIVLCDTGKPRALTDSAYNERRSQCEAASKALGVDKLRDATIERLEKRKSVMDPIIVKRARHVLSEDERCIRFVDALDRKKLDLIGKLMRQSHESLRDDYEVSSPELDAMAEAAWKADGCVGARMTGAGFGGACVALVRSDSVPNFIADTATIYKRATNLGGNFIACKAAEGARILL
jgi:galactokinase